MFEGVDPLQFLTHLWKLEIEQNGLRRGPAEAW